MGFVLGLISWLLGLYAILLLVQLALPFFTDSQRPWMTVLDKICEPGIRIGNRVAAKLLPARRTKVNVGALTAVVLCWLARVVLRLFLF